MPNWPLRAIIEWSWEREIQGALCGADGIRPIRQALQPYGTPPWFYRQHAPRIWSELQAEEEARRGKVGLGAPGSARVPCLAGAGGN